MYCRHQRAGPGFLFRPGSLLSLLSVEELVREMEQYQGLRAFRLEGNTVGVDAARAIAKALESKGLLQVLEITKKKHKESKKH